MENETINEIYQVKTPQFEGPFNLLLNLIEEKKLFINEISLAFICEDYLNYLTELQDSKHEKISNFIIIASTLILIKSKSILPNLELSKEEEEDVHKLEERLKLYQYYLKLSFMVNESFAKNIIFHSEERTDNLNIFVPDNKINKENVYFIAQEILNKIPKKEKLQEVEVKKIISIEEMIDSITKRIQESLSFKFVGKDHKIQSKEEKVYLIVSFLAILELTRQGILSVVQENSFEEILVEKYKGEQLEEFYV